MSADPAKRSWPAFVRPPIAALLVATVPFVTECSEGDGHLRAVIGPGSAWVSWHAMPSGFVWMPDDVQIVSSGIVWMLALALVTLAAFALFEWLHAARGPMIATGLVWTAAWLGTLVPFPFLFLGFLGPVALVPVVLVALAIELIAKRRKARAPP